MSKQRLWAGKYHIEQSLWNVTQECGTLILWLLVPRYTALTFLYPLPPPPQTVCALRTGTVFTSVHPSARDILVFRYLEKAMTEFHNIWQHIDIHKMNIYNRKIRARGHFFLELLPFVILNLRLFGFSLLTWTCNDGISSNFAANTLISTDEHLQ